MTTICHTNIYEAKNRSYQKEKYITRDEGSSGKIYNSGGGSSGGSSGGGFRYK